MRIATCCGIAALSLTFTAPASAAVLDFNEFTSPLSFSSDYQSQGFRIATAAPFFLDFYRYGPGYSNNADADGGSLAFSAQPPTQAFLTRLDSGTFTLNSLLVTNFFDVVTGVPPREITFSFTTASGTDTQTFTVDNGAGFQLVELNRTGLTSFGFSGPVQIDDVVLDQAVGGAVPEPATWAMMIGGAGMVGGALRRRKANFSVRCA